VGASGCPPAGGGGAIVSLLALAASHDDPPSTTHKRALLRRVTETIRERCHESDLDPARVAAALGLSRRYVHLLFAYAGKTFSQELYDCRLPPGAAAAARQAIRRARNCRNRLELRVQRAQPLRSPISRAIRCDAERLPAEHRELTNGSAIGGALRFFTVPATCGSNRFPNPSRGPGDVKLRVIYNGICGSDLHDITTGR